MANTLLNSEVVSRMVNEKMAGRGVLYQVAVNLGNLPNGVQAGDTRSIIKIAHLSEMKDLAKGDAIELEDITQTESKETIEHKGKGFQVYDYEAKTTIGGETLIDRKISDMADLRVRAIEKSLGKKCANAPLRYKTSMPDDLTYMDINKALTQAFGDDQDANSFEGIYINSRLIESFINMEGFVRTEYTYSANQNGVIRNGILGFYRGIPVFVTDVTTYDTTLNECITFILKKNAIGFEPDGGSVEVTRNARYKRTEVYDDIMFVTGVIDDTGVVVLRKTIA